MDKKDVKLLAILQQQGRISIADLANKVNMSDTPCLRRVKKLEQDQIILGYQAQLDPQKLGLKVSAYLYIRLNDCSFEQTEAFELAVAKVANVMECVSVSGDYDYMLKVMVEDLAALDMLTKKQLKSLPMVFQVNANVVLKSAFTRPHLPIESC
ncbi:Lrp/AsnC family transcriptional regulator [Shewanella gaetbuli]